jgi:hypothetical protein
MSKKRCAPVADPIQVIQMYPGSKAKPYDEYCNDFAGDSRIHTTCLREISTTAYPNELKD